MPSKAIETVADVLIDIARVASENDTGHTSAIDAKILLDALTELRRNVKETALDAKRIETAIARLTVDKDHHDHNVIAGRALAAIFVQCTPSLGHSRKEALDKALANSGLSAIKCLS